MTVTITKGIDGKRVETLGKYTVDQMDKMDTDFDEWKKLKSTQKKYRIQWYNRIIFKPTSRKLIIDFGDYSYFGLVRMNKNEWKVFNERANKPVNLDV